METQATQVRNVRSNALLETERASFFEQVCSAYRRGVSTKETGSVWEGARLKIHALARDIALARPAASRSPMLFWRRLASSTPPGWGFSASAAPSARGETRRAKSRASQRRPENGNGIKPRQLPAVNGRTFAPEAGQVDDACLVWRTPQIFQRNVAGNPSRSLANVPCRAHRSVTDRHTELRCS